MRVELAIKDLRRKGGLELIAKTPEHSNHIERFFRSYITRDNVYMLQASGGKRGKIKGKERRPGV
jgi:hypothetical protein